jgi:hypothetical protein
MNTRNFQTFSELEAASTEPAPCSGEVAPFTNPPGEFIDRVSTDILPKRRTRGVAAFCRLPNSVARDKRLSPPALVLVAYRSTYIGNFALNENALLRVPIVSGLGRDAIRQGIGEASEAGYLDRRQTRPMADGQFGRAIEWLTLPPCGASGKAGRMLRREWFDGTVSVDAMAAYLFARAGTGEGPSLYTTEVMDRFGWSRPTAGKVLKELIKFALLAKQEVRATNGRKVSGGVSYRPLAPALWAKRTSVKKPGDGAPGNGMAGHLLTCPPHALPKKGAPSSLTAKEAGQYSSQASPCEPPCEVSFEGEGTALEWAFDQPNLLGWLGDDERAWVHDLEKISDELVARVANAMSDGDLVRHIKTATKGRVSTAILTPAGLQAVRYLAAMVLGEAIEAEQNSTQAPLEALVVVLNGIFDRVGACCDVWLNSLKLIGDRIISSVDSGNSVPERLYARDTSSEFFIKRDH